MSDGTSKSTSMWMSWTGWIGERGRPGRLLSAVALLVATQFLPSSSLADTAPKPPAPIAVGDAMPALSLRDQHGADSRIEPSTALLLFTADMTGGGYVKEALSEGGRETLAAARGQYVSDVSRMPGFVLKTFALPSMRKHAAASRRPEPASGSTSWTLEQRILEQTRRSSALRFVRGRLAAQLLATRTWSQLGFARLSDYSRERLGVAGRTLEDDARVARALERLPKVTAAFLASELSWTQVRVLTSIVNPRNEERWLELAKTLDTRSLEARLPKNASRDRHAADEDPDDRNVRFSVRLSRNGRRMWRTACEFAERSAGSVLTQAQVLELVVAEAASGAPCGDGFEPARPSSPDDVAPSSTASAPTRERPFSPLVPQFIHEPREPAVRRFLHDVANRENLTAPQWLSDVAPVVRSLEERNAFRLDAGLREVKRAMQCIDAELGHLLRLALEQRTHQAAGFRRFADYVEARFGFCARTAWSLIAIDRAASRICPDLFAAYQEGRLSHLAAAILLPVMTPRHAAAWVERAAAVTLRRLEDEVAWVLDRRDAEHSAGSLSDLAPPPLDHDLRSDVAMSGGDDSANNSGGATGDGEVMAEDASNGDANVTAGVQMRAASEVELHFLAPSSVCRLAEATMQAIRHGAESRSAAFERMVAAALVEWMSAPAHRDPVFARDGWRCAVPGCRSRRNLHDHHILFRSKGGANDRDNRVTVCAAHHLHGIHEGHVRAHGRAPSEILWELGCRLWPHGPIARLQGDRYLMQA